MNSDDNGISSEELEEKLKETDEKEESVTGLLEDILSNIGFLGDFTENYTSSYFGGQSLQKFMSDDPSSQQIQIISYLICSIELDHSNSTTPGGGDDSEVQKLINKLYETFPLHEQRPEIYNELYNMVLHQPIRLFRYIDSLNNEENSIDFFRDFIQFATDNYLDDIGFNSFMDRGVRLEDIEFAERLMESVPLDLMQSALDNRGCDIYELAIIYRGYTEDEIIRAFCAEDPDSIFAQYPQMYFLPLYDNEEYSSSFSSYVTNSEEEFTMFFPRSLFDFPAE